MMLLQRSASSRSAAAALVPPARHAMAPARRLFRGTAPSPRSAELPRLLPAAGRTPGPASKVAQAQKPASSSIAAELLPAMAAAVKNGVSSIASLLRGEGQPVSVDDIPPAQRRRAGYTLHVLHAFDTPADVLALATDKLLTLENVRDKSAAWHLTWLQKAVGTIAAYCSPRVPEQYAVGHVLCTLCALFFLNKLPKERLAPGQMPAVDATFKPGGLLVTLPEVGKMITRLWDATTPCGAAPCPASVEQGGIGVEALFEPYWASPFAFMANVGWEPEKGPQLLVNVIGMRQALKRTLPAFDGIGYRSGDVVLVSPGAAFVSVVHVLIKEGAMRGSAGLGMSAAGACSKLILGFVARVAALTEGSFLAPAPLHVDMLARLPSKLRVGSLSGDGDEDNDGGGGDDDELAFELLFKKLRANKDPLFYALPGGDGAPPVRFALPELLLRGLLLASDNLPHAKLEGIGRRKQRRRDRGQGRRPDQGFGKRHDNDQERRRR